MSVPGVLRILEVLTAVGTDPLSSLGVDPPRLFCRGYVLPAVGFLQVVADGLTLVLEDRLDPVRPVLVTQQVLVPLGQDEPGLARGVDQRRVDPGPTHGHLAHRDEQGLTVLAQGPRLLRGRIEEHGIFRPRVSAEAFPELPPKRLQGLSRHLALTHLAVGPGLPRPTGARMDGERDRMTGTRAAATRR